MIITEFTVEEEIGSKQIYHLNIPIIKSERRPKLVNNFYLKIYSNNDMFKVKSSNLIVYYYCIKQTVTESQKTAVTSND